jgi:hypothetical protein
VRICHDPAAALSFGRHVQRLQLDALQTLHREQLWLVGQDFGDQRPEHLRLPGAPDPTRVALAGAVDV